MPEESRSRPARGPLRRLRMNRRALLGTSDRDWTPKPGQLLLSGAVLVLAYALVLTGLTAVLAGGSWILQALAIATPTILVSTLARVLRSRLRTVAVLLGAAAGAAVWTLWFVRSGRAGAWLHDPLGALRQIQVHILAGSAPLDPTGPLADLLLLVVLLAAVLTSLVLVGLGKPLGAGVTVSVLLLLPALVTGVSVGWAALLGAGLLLAVLTWLGSPAPSRAGLIAAGAAVAIAAAAVAVAPSTRDRVWNDALLPGPVSDAVPDVTIALAEDLRERTSTRAFTFTASEPGPYRFTLATLSDFTGGRWLPQEALEPDGLTVSSARSPATLPPETVPLSDEAGSTSVTVTIEGLLSGWLPLPQSAVGVERGEEGSGFDPEQWHWTAEAATARAERTITRRGEQYTADADQLFADRDTLARVSAAPEGATRLYSSADTAPEDLAPYLELPPGMPAELDAAATEAAGTAADRLAVGLALQDWFRDGGFVYDESAPYQPGADPDDPYAVMVALLEQREGFCVHYASTFAVMARELGAPTRLAVGYASRVFGDNEAVVHGRDLHAWPEIYIDGVGWVAFEPTPGGAGLRADTNERVPAIPWADQPEESAAEPTPAPQTAPLPEETPGNVEAGSAQNRDRDPPSDITAARATALWSGGIVVALLLLLPAGVRRIRARRRIGRISAGDRPAQHAWDEFVDTATDLGLLDADGATSAPRARTAEALIDYLESTGELTADASAAARRLAGAMAAERYGEAGSEEQVDARAELRQAIRGLVDGTPGSAVVRAALLPRSVLRSRQREPRP